MSPRKHPPAASRPPALRCTVLRGTFSRARQRASRYSCCSRARRRRRRSSPTRSWASASPTAASTAPQVGKGGDGLRLSVDAALPAACRCLACGMARCAYRRAALRRARGRGVLLWTWFRDPFPFGCGRCSPQANALQSETAPTAGALLVGYYYYTYSRILAPRAQHCAAEGVSSYGAQREVQAREGVEQPVDRGRTHEGPLKDL